jgi:hypothetical protein
MTQPPPPESPVRLPFAIMTALALVLIAIAVAWPSRNGGGSGGPVARRGGTTAAGGRAATPQTVSTAAPVAVDAITAAPARYLGRTVTVAGVVARIAGPRELVLRGEDAIQRGRSGPNRLLVVVATHVPDVPGRADDRRIVAGDPIVLGGRVANLRTLRSSVAPRVGYHGVPTLVATRIGVARG